MKNNLKQTTIDKIVRNSVNGTLTKMGRYYYQTDLYRGYILRCHQDHLEREWIDNDGRHYSKWEIVADIGYIGNATGNSDC